MRLETSMVGILGESSPHYPSGQSLALVQFRFLSWLTEKPRWPLPFGRRRVSHWDVLLADACRT